MPEFILSKRNISNDLFKLELNLARLRNLSSWIKNNEFLITKFIFHNLFFYEIGILIIIFLELHFTNIAYGV